jgi:hypothetical protein
LIYQHDTALYTTHCLTCWDWISPYKICALFIYSLPVPPWHLPQPNS